ncbi:MAG: AmmeMemoRadiSam system protein B [Byssovorax sp.]
MLNVRPAAVAGSFYPADPVELRAEVDDLLANAAPAIRARATPPPNVPKALIVPHAGYVYSGPIAATAYARLGPARGRVRRVVLLGPAHRVHIRGLALPEADLFRTPLGDVPLDAEACALLSDLPRNAAAHLREHSLEVQLPFLIQVLGDFHLVPLAVGDAEPEEVAAVLDALWGGPETLIVISSDLSHYLPYALGRRVDTETADAILRLDLGPIDHEHACGATPLAGLLLVARQRGLRPEMVDLESSGDTAGDRSQVVGYGAFAFYEGDRDARA